MGWILYDDSKFGNESVDVPLGLTRRIVFVSIGGVLGIIGFTTTILFQILSKTNNDLRQRGRYLVTGQGYTATAMTTIVFMYQAFMYRFPCFVLFWAVYTCFLGFILFFMARAWRLVTRYDRSRAIYEAPLTVQDDEDGMLDIQQGMSQSGTVHSMSESTASSHTVVVNDSGQSTTTKVSSEQSPEEAALAKRWYKRYWNLTDRRALWFFVVIYGACLGMALGFQIYNQVEGKNLSIYNPMSFNCHQSFEYYPAQFVAVIFVFVFSPALIYRLRNFKDGFGIRNDLLAVSIMGIPGIVLFVVVPTFAEAISDQYLDRTTWIALVLILSHIFAVIMPLMRYLMSSNRRCAVDAAAAASGSNGGGGGIKQAASQLGRAHTSDGTGRHDSGIGGGGGGGGGKGRSRVASTRRRPHDIALEPIHTPTSHGSGGSSHHMTTADLGTIVAQRRPSRAGGVSNNFSLWGRPMDDDIRYDWDAFVKALDDPEVFDRISAFTVGEFCAENTRFLAELARLEMRAQRYERLRNMTVGGNGSGTSLLAVVASGAGAGAGEAGSSTTTTQPPHRFPPSDIDLHAYDPNHGGSRQRIKKIVSVSSVSSSMPMLGGSSGKGRSSLSLDDFSEPPSPLGAPPVIRAPAIGPRSSPSLDYLRTALPVSEERAKEKPTEQQEVLTDEVGFPPLSTAQQGVHGGKAVMTIKTTEGPSQGGVQGSPESPREAAGRYHGGGMTFPETAMAPLPMPPTLLIQFQNIYRTYIRHGGRLELNLSHDTYLEIAGMAKRGEWRADMFEGAKIEVYELLFRDVWSKFVSASHSWLVARAGETAHA